MTDPDSRKPTTWKDFTHLNWDTTLSKSLSFSYSICFIWATCEFAAMADIFTTQPLILLHKSSMLSQWLQSTSTKADRGMSVSVTIHRDSLICAVCSSVTAAKELFLFNADQWTDEERAAWGRPHLRLKRHSALATVAGGVTMPTAWTGSVLIRRHLFFKALSLTVSEISAPAAESYSPLPQDDTELQPP